MKSKMLLTTIGVACVSLMLGGCGSDNEDVNASLVPAPVSVEKDMSDSMVDGMKESAGAVVEEVVESVEGMANEAVSKVEDVVADTVETGKAAMDDAVKSMQDKLPGGDVVDAESEAETEVDKMKNDLGAEMKKLL